MTIFPRRRLFSLAGGVAAGSVLASQGVARAAGAPPATIPTLQSWTEAAGQYTFAAGTRILLASAQAGELRNAADVLADDLRRVTGIAAQVVEQATPAPQPGDILLTLTAPTPGPSDEGYELAVGASMQVRGAKRGVFNGTRTIVQWLRQTRTVNAGVARDWPKYPERGFLVANSAKKFSLQWWEGQVRELSYLKLNLLWIYTGYGLDNAADVRAIRDLAARFNVQVIPQHNMPDHMYLPLAERPDLQLPGRTGSLDLSKPAATVWAQQLTSSLIGDFPSSPHWHLGSDEYLLGSSYDNYPQLLAEARRRFGSGAVAADIHYGFVNDLNDTVRAAGKTMRIWNDGIFDNATVPIDKNVVIEHWTQWDNRKTPQRLIDEGYKLHNSNQDFLYYDPGSRYPSAANIYDNWRVGLFQAGHTVSDNSTALLGAKIHLWTLDTEFEALQSDRLAPAFRSFAQILWGSTKPFPTHAGGFAALSSALGRAPGFPTMRRRVSPVNGARSVWPRRVVTVEFQDPIVASSLLLTNGSPEGTSYPGTVNYNPTTKIATFTTTSPWPYGVSTHMNLSARDAAGNVISPPHVWGFTTALKPNIFYPRSIWNDEDGPNNEYVMEGRPLELGVKFRSDVPGQVLGVKFYKSPGDLGLHTGNLWSRGGANLARATFTGESVSGWQEVRFASPVRIQADTTYVASYNTRLGIYGYNRPYFGASIDNGVLHALQTGADGGNGVFKYGLNLFPNESFENTNYWADVVFMPDTYGLWNRSDAPALGATDPQSLEIGVKFSSSANGRVLGVRFFKGTHNTGTHVGSVWNGMGQRLASATFTNESASGWQEVRFANPVQIVAGQTVTVSYSSPTGAWSATEQGFATERLNGSLRAPANGGVFAVGQGNFPTSTFNNRNYYTDVVFSHG